MSCFWDGLNKALIARGRSKIKDSRSLIMFCKLSNIPTIHVKCNGVYPTKKQMQENMEAIANLDPKDVNNGYLCSTFDPVLFLITEKLNLVIYHDYNGTLIKYEHDNPKHVIHVRSNSGHFWFVK